MAGERVAFQGLPARICWLGYGERDQAGLRFNEMVAAGALKAPIVIGRDHLDCGSVASPYREDRANARRVRRHRRLAAAQRAVEHRQRRLLGLHPRRRRRRDRPFIHAGQVSVADGTALAAEKLDRVLTNDPGIGVIRHVDAGYEQASTVAVQRGVRVPMADGSAVSARGTSSPVRPTSPTVARARTDRPRPADRRLPPLLLDPGGRRLPGLVYRAGHQARPGRGDR